MQIYLPIAEIPLNIFLLFGLGMLGGFLAGMFGIGGGFLITPFLIFIGVPPAVAVATSTNQIIASSVSGFAAHWHRGNVDVKMGGFLLFGGLLGAYIGVMIFNFLKSLGLIDVTISLIYVVFLGSIGVLMAIESYTTIRRQKKAKRTGSKVEVKKRRKLIESLKLPLKTNFEKSGLNISVLLPVGIGIFAGMLVSLMGIGGGFIMIPAMIYLLGMPTSLVVGTSLFQIIFTTSFVTMLHALTTSSVDIVLASLLIIGGVLGAQFGTAASLKVSAEKLRGLLALIVLLVCARLASQLFIQPDDLFSIEEMLR